MFVKDTHSRQHKKIVAKQRKNKVPTTSNNNPQQNSAKPCWKRKLHLKTQSAQRFVTKQSFISNDTQK
jgi:hypothetical protein